MSRCQRSKPPIASGIALLLICAGGLFAANTPISALGTPAALEALPQAGGQPVESVVVSQDWDEIRRFMWNYVGIVRSNQRLERARKRITLLQDEIHSYYWNVLPSSDLIELRNIATVAELIIACASLRHESRGLHTTIDYPEPRASEQHDTVIQRGSSRAPSCPARLRSWRRIRMRSASRRASVSMNPFSPSRITVTISVVASATIGRPTIIASITARPMLV